MRRILFGLVASLLAGSASAADYLRGSAYDGPPPALSHRWSGFYFGGQVGRTNGSARFGSTPRPAVDPLRPVLESAAQLADWSTMPDGGDSRLSYGGFVGYNAQWGDVVLGVEANYNHTSLDVRTSSQVLSGVAPGALITYTGRANMTDYGTFRVRAGYAWDWVMPYVFSGLAIGNANYTRTATTSYPVPPALLPTYTDTDTRNGVLSAGWTVGAGVDVAVFGGFFLRGEYEFVQFAATQGTTMRLSTFRAGAGYKF
ncbi:MAG: porin family protein [Variibacter sp.]|nr:porin family protein [Variibacter sp.]